MELAISHELIGEKMLDLQQLPLEHSCSPQSIDEKAPRVSGASNLVRAVAHRRFEAPSMITKARYALLPNLISS